VKLIALIPVAIVIMPIILFVAGLSIISQVVFAGGGDACTIAGSATSAAAGVRPDQMSNAATIVAVGKQLSVSPQGWVVAIAAALQESGLVNLDHGDRDSLGLFQQRPSQGWGTPAQIMNPSYAATQFYRHLLAVPGWQQMSVNDAAQAVERSGFPDAYAQHEQTARKIVAAVAGVTCADSPAYAGTCDHILAPNAVAWAAVNWACGQRGLPYVWGGNGNPGFDCSGLAKAAYAAAGITLPRVAQDQYNAGPPLSAGKPLQPGDLVFFGASTSTVTHVGIAISPTAMVDAPDVGEVVRIDPIGHNMIGATRPAAAPASP
jgi:cell wall-associated NlpC family hydrolase